MKRFITALLAITCLPYFYSCKKSLHPETVWIPVIPVGEGSPAMRVPPPCSFTYFALTVTGTGTSQLWRFANSPGNPTVSIGPVNGSAGNNVIGFSSPGSVQYMTGIAYNPNTGIFYGTTGNAGPTPNSLITFSLTNPNSATIAPITTCGGVALNLSDIERNPVNGQYLAINRGTVPPNNRVLQINVPSPSTTCLANVITPTIPMRGLTFDCSGNTHVIRPFLGPGSFTALVSPTGSIGPPNTYPGVVTTSGGSAPEVGLHWDCTCINRYVTGSGNQPNPLLTDGQPASFPGGAIYNAASTPIAIPPIVDFAR